MSLSRDSVSLKALCLKGIVRQPKVALTKRKVTEAFYSTQACALLQSYKVLQVHENKNVIELTSVRQTIIKELIESGGRDVHSDFPLPPNFFDDTSEYLSFASSRVSESFIQETLGKKCTTLKELNLSGCFLITNNAILVLLKGCKMLNRLDISSCRKLSDTACDHIVSDGTRIEALDLGGCYNITHMGITRLLRTHPNRASFYELNLSGLGLADQTIQLMYRHCPRLKIVGIGFTAVTELTLYALVKALAQTLLTLSVHWCPAPTVTDTMVAWLAMGAPYLSSLDLTGCKGITLAGLKPFLESRNAYSIIEGENAVPAVIKKLSIRYTGVNRQQAELFEKTYPSIDLVK